MVISIGKLLIINTIFIIVGLNLVIFIGLINYDHDSNPTPTLSSIIANHPLNSFIYTVFVSMYTVTKTVLSQCIYIEPNNSNKSIINVLAHFIIFFTSIQLIGMTCIVFLPVYDFNEYHLYVANISFISAILKSIFLFIRRVYIDHNKYYIFINFLFICMISTLATLFRIYWDGFIEWLLIILIMMENFFLIADYFKVYVKITYITLL